MPSTKTYRDYILEQLSDLPDLACRPMMGEFLLYSNGILFGGIYDDHLLIKPTPATTKYHLPKALPYPGARPMYLANNPDDKTSLIAIVTSTIKDLEKIRL